MNQIQGLTDAPAQTFTVPLPDGSQLSVSITYSYNRAGWFISFDWNGQTPDWQTGLMRVTTFPNILRHFKGYLPFGIMVATADNGEPQGVSDWADGYASMYLLDAIDIAYIEATLFPGPT